MAHWLRIGDIELLVVSDGVIWQDAGATFGLVPRIMWERYAPEIDEKYRLPVGLNTLVVRSAGKTVLIDSGCGSKSTHAPGAMGIENTGHLIANLATEGIRAEDVDVVLNTHLHFDHCGGNTGLDGGRPIPAFPRAKYILQKGEWDAASHPNERTRGTYLAENFEPLDDARQVELVEGDAEIVPGLRMTMAPGHTEDHVVFEVESGGDVAIYIGELAQQPVQLERVAWVSAFDILPMVSIETKKRFIEKALDRRALLVSVHAPYPGLGRLRTGDGKRKWEGMSAGHFERWWQAEHRRRGQTPATGELIRRLDLIQIWQQLTQLFEELLTSPHLALPSSSRERIGRDVHHNEFGLAFDELLAVIRKESLDIDEVNIKRIDGIGRAMRIDPSRWADIGNRVVEDSGEKENGADS